MSEASPGSSVQDLHSALTRLVEGRSGEDDLRLLQHALSSGQIVYARERGVAIGGHATGNIIITGDNTVFTLTAEALELLRPPYQPLSPPPAGELPEPGDVPPGSRMPFPRNAVFTGREKDLLEMAEPLLYSQKGRVGITQAAEVTTGLGGVGKSQLAAEFCYRYGRFFQGVHWTQAEQDLAAEIAACGSAMGLPRWPEKLPDQVAATLKAWGEGGARLLVLDNVVDPKTVQEWLPRLARARLLITSRRSDWPADLGLEVRPLDILPRAESKELLCRLASRLRKVPEGELDKMAERLGDLPLALDLAGRYLEERPELSPTEYLTELEDAKSALDHTSLHDWVEHSPTKHATSLAATFSLSWNQLGEGDILAKGIFRACGYCAPNVPIPRALLAKTVEGSDQGLDRALLRLSRLGLVKATNLGPSLHPLLAEFARLQDRGTESSLPALAQALMDLAATANKSGLPQQMEPLSKHLRAVALVSKERELEIAGGLWNELGYHLNMVADYDEARKCFERAWRICRARLGDNHPTTKTVKSNLDLLDSVPSTDKSKP